MWDKLIYAINDDYRLKIQIKPYRILIQINRFQSPPVSLKDGKTQPNLVFGVVLVSLTCPALSLSNTDRELDRLSILHKIGLKPAPCRTRCYKGT